VLATGLAYCKEVRGMLEALLARRLPPVVIAADQGGWRVAGGKRAELPAAPVRHWCCRCLLGADKGDQWQRGDWMGSALVVWLQQYCRGFLAVPGNRGTLNILEDTVGEGSPSLEIDYGLFCAGVRAASPQSTGLCW